MLTRLKSAVVIAVLCFFAVAVQTQPLYERAPREQRKLLESSSPRELLSREYRRSAQRLEERIQQRGREVKRAKERSRRKDIPEVSLTSVHDLWEDKSRRSLRALDGAKLHRKRALSAERPNGVSEMPDPEAAEYLAEHQTKDLGTDVMNAAKLHYNGTQGGTVHPLSTDKHATTEEHATQGMNEASLHDHTQHSEAVAKRYASFQHEDEASEAVQASPPPPVAEPQQNQEGYPWYAEYPDPSFPHANLTKTNHAIYKALIDTKTEQLAAAAASQVEPKTVADITRDSLDAEKQVQASIWARSSSKGPGDGGQLPPGSYIFAASGGNDLTPARKARDQLAQLRAGARVWMSPQEAGLIESYLRPEDVMLEFGSGYSTMWFSQFVKQYYSIEHNATWFDEIKSQINSTRKNVHLQVAPVAQGYKGWGGGFEEGTFAQFERYILAVDNFKVTRFDRVLVDGRARASCAEYVLKFLHSDSLVFIHDYQDRYFYHGIAEQFYNKVAETYDGQSLVVLRPKPEALKRAAREAVASLAAT